MMAGPRPSQPGPAGQRDAPLPRSLPWTWRAGGGGPPVDAAASASRGRGGQAGAGGGEGGGVLLAGAVRGVCPTLLGVALASPVR